MDFSVVEATWRLLLQFPYKSVWRLCHVEIQVKKGAVLEPTKMLDIG